MHRHILIPPQLYNDDDDQHPHSQQYQPAINYNNKMQIDLASLPYKITKPPLIYPSDYTLARNSLPEEQAANPFRRTSRLFKHIDQNKSIEHKPKSKEAIGQKSAFDSSTLPYFKNVYSLQNFDSFQDCKNLLPDFQQTELENYASHQSNKQNFIKAAADSEDISVLIKQLSQSQANFQDFSANLLKAEPIRSDEPKREKIFFLTAQEESESSVQQFYFKLKDEPLLAKFSSNVSSTKKQIKNSLNKFAEELEMIPEESIDKQFLGRLQDCLGTVRAPLAQKQEESSTFTPKKWNKPNRKMQADEAPLKVNKSIKLESQMGQKQNKIEYRNLPFKCKQIRHGACGKKKKWTL